MLSNILKNIQLYFILRLLSSIFIQFISLFLVYLLSPQDFGYLSLIISVSQIMFTLTSGWSNGAILSLGTKNFLTKGSYKDIVIYRSVIVLFCFLVVSIFFKILRISILEIVHLDENINYVFYLFLGYVFYDFAYQLLYPGNKNNIQSILEIIYASSFFLITIIFVRNIQVYTYTFLIATFIFFILTLLFFYFYFGKDQFKWNKKEFNFVLNYSSWQLMSVLGIYLINLGNNYIFVLNSIPVESIGIYNFAFKLFSGFSVFFGLFGIIIPKWINREDIDYKKLMKRIYYIIIALSLGYLLLASIIKPFINFIGKSDYLDSVNFFYLLFPAFIFMTYVNLMNTIIANTKFYKMAQFAILIQVIIIFSIGIPLVKFYGLYGAVVATTISYLICSLFFYLLYVKKVLKSLKNNKVW